MVIRIERVIEIDLARGGRLCRVAPSRGHLQNH